MDNVETIISHAERYCTNHGSRLTTKRKRVLASLVKSEKALSAYDLIALCEQSFGEKIPAMSVYRILEFLEAENLVHKLNLAKKYVACSHITCDHDHGVPQFLICGECNHVKEISINKQTITELQKNVAHAGFQLVSPQLEMNCICNSCAAKAA